jgi:GTPase SAR1 family protein
MNPRKRRLIYKITFLGENFNSRKKIRLKHLTEVSGQYYSSSLGTDFSVKLNSFMGYEIVSQVWDIKPDEKYAALRENYYTGTCGLIVAFSLHDIDSFKKMPFWINDIFSNPNITQVKLPILIIGIKTGNEEQVISDKKIKEYVDQLSEWLSLEVKYLIIDETGEEIYYPKDIVFKDFYNEFLMQIVTIREKKLIPRKTPPKPEFNN